MSSVRASRSEKDPNAFPYKQLTILAICRFSEPIAFNSILAYTYVLVRDLRGTEQDAGFYAGLLVSAYAVAEAITAMGWGALSDRYGRKPIVLIGLGGVALSSLIFGLAQSYWVALLARFIGGALNGNVSVMQTMVAEMVKNPEHEPKAYATQPFVWVLGGIIGSAMGGYLAQPSHFYPDIFPEDGLFGRYPYLLPNLVAMIAVIIAIIQGIFFLEETNPRAARRGGGATGAGTGIGATYDDDEVAISDEDEEDVNGGVNGPHDEATALLSEQRVARLNGRAKRHSSNGRAGIRAPSESRIKGPVFMEESLPLPIEQTFDIRRSSMSTLASFKADNIRSGSVQPSGLRNSQQAASSSSSYDDETEYDGPVWSFKILMLIVAMVLVSYHQMAFSALFPIHLLDEPAAGLPSLHPGQIDFRGGLGYTVHDVGSYLASNGCIALFIQAVIFPVFVARVGVWRSFVAMVILYPTAYVLMPFISAMPTVELSSLGLTLSLLMQSFYGIIAIPCALILLKDATPHATVLGRVNGLAMSGCCLARTVGPPLAGIIFSSGGSAAAWFSCAAVAVVGVLQLFFIPHREKKKSKRGADEVEDAVAAGEEEQQQQPPPRVHVEA
ncbi:major facilitator superfamily domain-containing protein [Microdochium bolleyi]|uniref:Major facilitator superfamily domain-containing protein n=1 Tax=Microdochium bolleyi TaxID=196109 RepID=A0A136JEY6_9PEZI|nr:major facilitator superfamily domain-containing protein [Microdochium bolleyi]